MKIIKLNQSKNLNYKIPENKKSLMMDFYLITYLNSMYNEKNVLNINEKIKFTLEEAENLILTYLKDHFLDIVHFAISAEFRHFIKKSDYTEIIYLNLTNEDEDILNVLSSYKDIFRSIDNVEVKHKDSYNIEYLKAYETLKKLNFTKEEFVKLAKLVFENTSWEYQYGGEQWGKICDAWLRLFKSKSKAEILTSIDNIYHSQHNTGSVFNKLDSYRINFSFEWIESFLNLKRDSKSIWGIYENASNNIKPIASFVIKAINEKNPGLNSEISYEDHIINKENNIINSYLNNGVISKYDENWIMKRLESELYSSNFENFINKHVKEYGEPPYFATNWAKNKLESDDYPKEWEIAILSFVKREGYPPGFAYQWFKNEIKSENYSKDLKDLITYFMEKTYPPNWLLTWMNYPVTKDG